LASIIPKYLVCHNDVFNGAIPDFDVKTIELEEKIFSCLKQLQPVALWFAPIRVGPKQ
jgi:hypothetical protein